MVVCNFCEDNVAMPYTCSLCNSKYCGKHRLPESHECININVYQTEEYRKQKLKKDREHQQVKAGNYYDSVDASEPMPVIRSPLFGTIDFWSHSNRNITVLLGGVILGASVGLWAAIIGFIMAYFLYSIIFTTIMFFIVITIRTSYATRLNESANFYIWPAGVALTLVTAVIFFPILMFGYLMNFRISSDKNANDIGTVTAVSFLGMWALMRYVVAPIVISTGIEFLSFLGSQYNNTILTFAIIRSGSIILLYGIFNLIPIGMYDGVRMRRYNSLNFWIIFFVYLIAVIFAFFT